MTLDWWRRKEKPVDLKTFGNVHKYTLILPQLPGAEPWKIRMGSAKVLSCFRKKLNVPDNKSEIYYQQRALTKRNGQMR